MGLRSTAVLIRVEDPGLVDDLYRHFLRSGFDVELVGGRMIDVSKPDGVGPTSERDAVTAHLAVWRVSNPGVSVEAID